MYSRAPGAGAAAAGISGRRAGGAAGAAAGAARGAVVVPGVARCWRAGGKRGTGTRRGPRAGCAAAVVLINFGGIAVKMDDITAGASMISKLHLCLATFKKRTCKQRRCRWCPQDCTCTPPSQPTLTLISHDSCGRITNIQGADKLSQPLEHHLAV